MNSYADKFQTFTGDCQEHGPFEVKAFRKDLARCPQCAAKAEEARRSERAKQEKQELVDRIIARAGIPARFKSKRLSDFLPTGKPQKSIHDYAVRFAQGFAQHLAAGDNLIFYGNSGTGKTHLACGIAAAVMQDGNSARYMTAYDLVRSIKATWGAGESEIAVVNDLVGYQLLIVDEVGVQFGSNAENVILFDVLNKRYAELKPTILISNLDLAGITGYMGERIMDRFREGGSRQIPFLWESCR